MSINSRSTKPTERPSCPQLTRAQKTAIAFASVIFSTAVLGGMLSLFETRSDEAAEARASVKARPSTVGLAVPKPASGSGV